MKKILLALIIPVCGFSQYNAEPKIEIENDTVKKKYINLEEVIITKEKTNPNLLRSHIKPLDLPQNIQIIDKSLINQQQAVRLSDVVRNINGAYVGSARGGAQESFWSRGYDLSANNIFKNGFRVSSGSMPEVSSLERVEFLKGNSALLFGNVVPGGVMNLVTKAPQFIFGGEASFQTGSYDFYKPSFDVYGPLISSIAYRFNSSYENSKSFRDLVSRERYYLNPSFLFKLNDKTDFTLQADYLNDKWTPDFGTAIIGKGIANLPRNLYLGAHWSHGKTTQTTVTGLLKHDMNKDWKFNANISYQDYNRAWKGTERIQPATDGTWKRPLGQAKNIERILAQQVSLAGTFTTGIFKHQLFTGIDWENSFVDAYTYPTTTIYDTVNVFNIESFSTDNGTEQELNPTKLTKTDTNRFGTYAQDLISFTKYFKVLAGLRWSWQETKVNEFNLINNPVEEKINPKRLDSAFSPKLGVVFQPTETTSIFASYSNSFTPNTGTDIYGEAIKPSIITQYEAGIKNEFFKNKLNLGMAVYHIVNDNLAQTAQFDVNGTINTNTNIKFLGGETTSKGFEIDINANPVKGWNIIAGYSYNDMRFTKTTLTHGGFVEGQRLTRTPYCTANFSTFYKFQKTFLKGINVGAIASYMGKRLGGWNNDYQISNTGVVTIRDRVFSLSDYTTLDLSLGYDWNQFSILTKVSNITNELNYVVHENYSANPIAPRQYMLVVKYKF